MEKIYPVISPDANIPGAIIASDGMDDNYNLKISSESYEVFVNNDKVGNKILLTQTDNPEDLNDFLKNNGFKDYKLNMSGNRIVIESNERPQQMKEILSTYLSTR